MRLIILILLLIIFINLPQLEYNFIFEKNLSFLESYGKIVNCC